MAVTVSQAQPPLCVDLDGTLIKSDVLLESVLVLLKKNPLYLFVLPLWLMRGKAALAAQVAARITLEPAALPYNRALVDWLRQEHAAGRSIWLCTTTNDRLSAAIATHLGIFDGVLANDPASRFGASGFDYCDNESRDVAVWRHENGAKKVLQAFPSRTSPLRAAFKALRPHQWAKNVLILVPLLAAHLHSVAGTRLIQTAVAMVAFCLCASSVYVLNDLLDLPADRAHARKSRRPFAAGDLSIGTGLIMAPALLITAIALAAFLPSKFQLVFATYYVVTASYSFGLKGIVLVDALLLAGLYTLRIIAGAAASEVPLSFWLLLFAVFLFLSLAFVKRFAELEALRRQQRLRAAGRGYHVEDLSLLQSLGIASGYMSVLVLALYINSPEIQALYERPKFIWMLCVLMLYWISRVWMKAQRGRMHDDPVVFALKDRVSLAIGLIAAVTVFAAI
jgi:4-hydroxybenzoate polyprenyltransferase